jgi:hypothetical protein
VRRGSSLGAGESSSHVGDGGVPTVDDPYDGRGSVIVVANGILDYERLVEIGGVGP